VRVRRTRPPRAPAGRTGFRGAEQGARSASPTRSERWNDPPLASCSAAKIELEPRRVAPSSPASPARSVENAGPGWGSRRRRSRRGERLRRAMRRTFRRTTHFSKNEYPTFTSPTAPQGFHPAGRRVSRFMAFHSLRITWVTRGGGVLLRLRARTGSSLTLHFGSLSAGPHERCRLSTTRSAFHPRSFAVRPGGVSSLELGPPLPSRPRPRRKRANPGVAHRLLQPT
jgi:hypothetical protein